MPGTTIGATFGNGFAGSYSRQPDMIINTFPVNAASDPIVFGEPAVLNSDGTVTRFGAIGTAATFVGVAAREVKTVTTIYTDQNEGGSYLPKEAAPIMERGCMAVICYEGTPAPGGAVYVRIVENGSDPRPVKVGRFEAAADTPNTVTLPNCRWGTTADANGVAELVMLGRNNA